MVRRLLSVCLMLLAVGVCRAHAQTSEHQRLGVERPTILEISVEQALDVSNYGVVDGSEFSLDMASSLDFRYLRAWTLGFSMPYTSVLADASAIPHAHFAIGDPSVSAGYSFRAGDSRISLGLSYSHPLGIFNPYEAQARGIATSSGYPTIRASAGTTVFSDPLALSARLDYAVGLPRADRSGSSWRPCDLSLSLNATEALNASFASTIGLSQRLMFPAVRNGMQDSRLPDYSAALSLTLSYSVADWFGRISVSKSLSSQNPPAVGISVGYTFSIKEKEAVE